MEEPKEKNSPMTSDQSFVAATCFVVLLFFVFLYTAVGDQILCWVNKNSGLASWIQAIGSIGAIAIAGYAVNKQIKFSKNQANEERIRAEGNVIYACLEAANEVRDVVENLGFYLKNGQEINVEEYLTKIQSLVEILKLLFGMKPKAAVISPLLILINQLDNTKMLISEYSSRKSSRKLGEVGYQVMRDMKVNEINEKAKKALENISLIYRTQS